MKKSITILMILFVVTNAASKSKVIPEISPYLSHRQILDLTYKNPGGTLVKTGTQLVLTALDGTLYRWDTENNLVNCSIHLVGNFQPGVFSQENYLTAKQLEPVKYPVVDLNEMKEIAVLENLPIERIVGLDHELVVYLAKNHEMVIFNYRTQKTLKNIKIKPKKEKEIYNAEFKDHTLRILTSRGLYIYDRTRDVVERVELKHPAASDFLRDNDMIYYGSEARELVKYSLKSRKIKWAFKIAEKLKIKPQLIGRYVVIIPEDNNIYFFNKNGTLYWWERLDSTRLRPPVTMKENVAVFLWDKKIKFFNYRKKQVITYPLNLKIKSNPVNIGDYIYVVTADKDSEGPGPEPAPCYLSEIGNRCGVEITSDPLYVKPRGKSIRFGLTGFNLVNPQFKIKILKNQPGEVTPLYEKTLTEKDTLSFLWIPPEAIEYRLIIETEAENKKGLVEEQRFIAVDVNEILGNYYYRLQTGCDANWLNSSDE